MLPVSRCLNKQLAELCKRSIQLESLSDKVAQLLPAELAAVCAVGSYTKGCLILTTQDAVWASQLRYALPELRDRLRKEAGMYQLTSVKVMVQVSEVRSATKNNTQAPALSEKAKATIISESQQCTYQPLKKALIDLALG